MGITLRTALWSWLVTLATLLLFVAAIIPQQERTFQEDLESKAHSVAVSLREMVAAAVVSNDPSSVVEHCNDVIHGDPSLEYLVVTKNDGSLSLIFDRSAWRQEPNPGPEWRPDNRQPTWGIGRVALFNRRVFHYSMPFDYSGIQWGWIHVGVSLRSYERSVRAVYLRTGVLAVGCILLSLAASAFYARRLVRPILGLRNVVQKVAGGDLAARAEINRRDELGTLARSINMMTEALLRRDQFLMEAKDTLELRVQERTQQLQEQVLAKDRAHAELAQAQHQLMEASRFAGMAEVATGVLHNVGNVLNSVNVSANLVGDRLRHSQIPSLTKLSSLLGLNRERLGDFFTSDPKGRLVPDFVAHLAMVLEDERSQMAGEMLHLLKNVEHIKEIVAMQQNYAKAGGIIEDLPVTGLIDDALRMNEGAFLRHHVVIQRQFEEVPLVRVDKHKVLQILVNLFRNAKYAMESAGHPDKVLVIGVAGNGHGQVKVTVHDNGIGIEPANLTRIFGHGFTTKKDGHGFGLHSGALAAKEMGGSLQAFSDGPGTGATFALELPVAAPKPPANHEVTHAPPP